MAHLVFPSILSADFGNLQEACEMVNNSEADEFHLDVMDGLFVPNISFGFPIIKAIHRHARKPLDVHLMIVQPHRYLERFRDAGANTLTIHYESNNHLHSLIETVKKLGMKACIAINPQSPVILLESIIANIDSVCIMSVNPGFGGQVFIENTFNKVKQLKEIILIRKTNTLIKVDGGIDLNNHSKLVKTGVDILVAGTSVFDSLNPQQSIENLKKIDN